MASALSFLGGACGTTVYCDVGKVDCARLFSCAFCDERLMERALLVDTAKLLAKNCPAGAKIPGWRSVGDALKFLDIKIGQLPDDDAARLEGFLGDAGCMRDAADAIQQPGVPSPEPLAAFRADSPFSV